MNSIKRAAAVATKIQNTAKDAGTITHSHLRILRTRIFHQCRLARDRA